MGEKKDDYLKYMTERAVAYWSPEAAEIRQARKQRREPWATRWFGVLPFGVSMWWGQLELRKHKSRAEARTKDSVAETPSQ
ncbi:YqzE family protein [Cohnella panacarvi]|uniref:YqzE family protein n=1 Tax=Cohnella panacarvi TaxID=400776 RepID=UPI00047D34ED|nr:YqzE family protein [Cohnella panacarvi]